MFFSFISEKKRGKDLLFSFYKERDLSKHFTLVIKQNFVKHHFSIKSFTRLHINVSVTKRE